MKYWLAPLKAEAHSTLCRRRKQKRGEKESTLEWESEVTEFIRSVGSEPLTCLWVSVAVPVHVFSLSSGRPHSPQSLCQSSLIVLALSSWFRFFVLCGSCDCPQTCFRPSQGNLSGLESHQREASKEDGLTRPLFVLLASFSALFVVHICMPCQYREFFSSSISPAVQSTQGLGQYPLCGLFIQVCLTKKMSVHQFLENIWSHSLDYLTQRQSL